MSGLAPIGEPRNNDDPERLPQAERLVTLAEQEFRFGRTCEGEPFAVPLGGPNVAILFRGQVESLRATLAKRYRQAHGRPPNAGSLSDALTVLKANAADAEPEPVHLRVAAFGENHIVIDLGDCSGQCVLVGPEGREIMPTAPVLFRRSALTAPLPRPERRGSLDQLRAMLNVTDETWPLLLGWLVAALIPWIPHPILMLGGEQGAGKTTAARVLGGLVDASVVPLRCEPRNVEAWAVTAAGSWVVVVDNVSAIPGWFSDALCRACTGDGLVRRRLYTDSGISVIRFRRVIILTSIDAGALRGDLGDRLLLIDLEPITQTQRRTETAIMAEYEALRPRLLGALLDLLSAVLQRLPAVNPSCLPRMADFARILAALDGVDGLDGRALVLYAGQSGRIAEEVVEGDAVATAIQDLIEVEEVWSGTAQDLLKRLTPDPVPRGWPKTPRAMAGRLRRLRPALAAVGIEMDYDRAATRARTRTYTIRRSVPDTVQTVQPSDKTPR